jgi:hypothetical protein
MRTRYEPDGWTVDGAKILSPENVEKIKHAFSKGPLIVQHWFYRGASAPSVFSFEEFEDFEAHLNENAVPVDAFDVWSFSEVCKTENMLAEAKLHDTDGCVPKGGAY